MRALTPLPEGRGVWTTQGEGIDPTARGEGGVDLSEGNEVGTLTLVMHWTCTKDTSLPKGDLER